MAQNLSGARAESAYVLELIGKKTLAPPEQQKVIEDSVRYWTENVNPAFLEYRKSVSTDYTAVEWQDEGAVFRDVHGKEFLDMLGGFGIYVTGHRHPKVLKAVKRAARQAGDPLAGADRSAPHLPGAPGLADHAGRPAVRLLHQLRAPSPSRRA